MTTPRTRRSRVFTISFPEDLAIKVEAIAKEESRTISELFRQTFRAYQMHRLDAKLQIARAEAAQRGPQIYTEDDVEALVDEIRSENYARSLERKRTA